MTVMQTEFLKAIVMKDAINLYNLLFLQNKFRLFFEFLYGTMKSRIVAVGINWRLAPPEVSYV